MNHLKLVGHVDIRPARQMLIDLAGLFEVETWRQDHPASPHKATRSIYLRMPAEITVHSVFESLEVVDRTAMKPFAELVQDMVLQLREPAAKLARVMLVELAPHSWIQPHRDEGTYAEATDRYHLAITSNQLCRMWVGTETAHMEPGEIWWFNKHIVHGVVNLGGYPRVHLIMDVFR